MADAVDLIELGVTHKGPIVHKATEIISHLRTFGRAAPVSRELISLKQMIERALFLMQEQLRLREIQVALDLVQEETVVVENPIQLEFINLLTNATKEVAKGTGLGEGATFRGEP